MRRPLFSIVVPTLNAERFLRWCLMSIENAGYPRTQVIVVDGGSTDGTLDVVKAFERTTEIVVLYRPPKGESNAINEGLKVAAGDVMAWLDADDEYRAACGARLWSASGYDNEQRPFHAVEKALQTAMWCYGKCKIIDDRGFTTRHRVTAFKEYWQKRYSYGALKRLCFIAQPAVFWRREAMENVGLLDESERYVMDYDYWLRLGALYEPAFIDQYLASWRSHPGSETARALLQDIEDARRVAKKYGGGIGADLTYWGTRLGYKAMGAL